VYPVSIESPRLIFRDFQEGDLDGCMGIVGDPDVTTSASTRAAATSRPRS
jgi:hypothetical protein